MNAGQRPALPGGHRLCEERNDVAVYELPRYARKDSEELLRKYRFDSFSKQYTLSPQR